MKFIALLIMPIVMLSPAMAKDAKFVGVWEGPHNTPVYTKLVFHKDESLTYCEVSSCRYVNCRKISVSGSLDSKFTYKDSTGAWAFNRISEEEIEATFVNAGGGVSTAIYEPE